MAVVLPSAPINLAGSCEAPCRFKQSSVHGLGKAPVTVRGHGRWTTQPKSKKGTLQIVRSSSSDMASNENEFDLSKYRLAEIEAVRQEKRYTDNKGKFDPPQWLILLKIQDTNSALAVYVGDFEGNSLKQEVPHSYSSSPRPMTHDLMRNTVEALGARVTKVCITALVENTYHARVHLAQQGSTEEVLIDSRPSDALNMAVRFGAPVYINKQVADKMAHPVSNFERKVEVPSDIMKSCKDALKRYHDPTVVHKINLHIAIEENRFEDAAKIRNEIEKLLSQDRTLSLVVAMESALEDKRWEEAAFLRNELTALIDNPKERQQKLQDAQS